MIPQGDPSGDTSERPSGSESVLEQYCGCFNRGDYFEAHEVLEELWLPVRRTEEGEFWKGLIQLAAAFVHVQRGRRGPALSLLRSARQRLAAAPPAAMSGVDAPRAIRLADEWMGWVESESSSAERLRRQPPQLVAGDSFRP